MTNILAVSSNKIWRNDITGLRAVAVLPVLLFHAFPEIFPGGFYGVDVFFVISGYLISGIIFRDVLANSFSYSDFYIRRIRRIFPNLILLLVFVAVVGSFFLSAKEFEGLGRHIYSSAFFYQNFRLMGEAGYFDGAAITKPLLHLWSLAIEEQFYILFPILVWGGWRLSHSVRYLGWLVGGITLSSLVGCMLVKDPTVNFYFPLTRFWELGLGICVAYEEKCRGFNFGNISSRLRDGMSTVGFAMILLSIGFYDEAFRAPGPMSLLPVIGACLLIIAHEDAFINRTVLSWRFMTFVGLISYSLYLWHWPLLSYLSIVMPVHSEGMTLLVLLLSFPVAALIYYFIETPARRARFGGNKFVYALCIGIVICLILGQVIKRSEGFPKRTIAVELGNIIDMTDPTGIPLYSMVVDDVKLATTLPEGNPEILFVGDSHAAQYVPRIKKLSEESGIQTGVITCLGCFAVPKVKALKNNGKCELVVAEYERLMDNPHIKKIVFGGIWGRYLHQRGEYMIPDSNGGLHELAEGGFEMGIRNIKDLISRYPEKQFFVLLDYPWSKDSYTALANLNRLTKEWDRKDHFEVPYPSLKHWKEGNERVRSELSGLVTFIPKISDRLAV